MDLVFFDFDEIIIREEYFFQIGDLNQAFTDLSEVERFSWA
jgi:hypothetical protein